MLIHICPRPVFSPMVFSPAVCAGDWSEGYFVFNVILAIIWGMISSIILIFMPIWESRKVNL